MTKEEQKEEFVRVFNENIKREGADKLLAWLETSDFFDAPSSANFHGNYGGGLCEHSLNVYKGLASLNKMFLSEPEQYSDETIALAGLLHDVCKINLYKPCEKNVKENGVWSTKQGYSIDEVFPIGHGEKSCLILQGYIKMSKDELLAIRWHMGAYDPAVKGGERGYTTAQKMSPLVTLLQAADSLAAHLTEKSV